MLCEFCLSKTKSRYNFKANLLYQFMHPSTPHLSDCFLKNLAALAIFQARFIGKNVLSISDINFTFLTGLVDLYIHLRIHIAPLYWSVHLADWQESIFH